MVALIQQLYQVEHAAVEMTPAARQALRQQQAVPLLAEITALRDELATSALPKSPVGDAVRYLTNQWEALQRYVDDGRLAIDNNRAENQLRVVAVGRKNWLFAGRFDGATRAALLYSLVQSCTLVGVSPFLYLTDVLLRVATHPHQRLDQLTPRGWAATFGPQPPPDRPHAIAPATPASRRCSSNASVPPQRQPPRHGRGDLQFVAVGSPHRGCAVVASSQQMAALVHQAMVATAQQDEIRNAGNAAVDPVPYVVGIADPGHAAREQAVFVPGVERSTDRRRNRAGLPADVERCSALVVGHRHHRRVAAKAPRRLRGDVHRALVRLHRSWKTFPCRHVLLAPTCTTT
jgi:hypothetical protein